MAATQPSGVVELDLIGSDGTIQAQSSVPATLWASSQSQINAAATAKGFTINEYDSPTSLTGLQPLQTLNDVTVWINSTSQYAGATAPASDGSSGSGISETTVVVGISAALLAGLGLLVWLRV